MHIEGIRTSIENSKNCHEDSQKAQTGFRCAKHQNPESGRSRFKDQLKQEAV
jgi:hypothetical protein